MKRLFWQILSYICGIILAAAIITSGNPFKALIVILTLFFVVLFIMSTFSYRKRLFKEEEFFLIEEKLDDEGFQLLANKLEKLGFKLIQKPFKFSNTNVIGYISESIEVYGEIVHIEKKPIKTSYHFMSRARDIPIGLITSIDRSIASIEYPSGTLRQVFVNFTIEELFLEHLQSIRWLDNMGIAIKPVERETFYKIEKEEISKIKEFLRIHWFRKWLVFFFRFIFLISPYTRPIEKQKRTVEFLRQFKKESIETPQSQARLKLIEQLSAVPVVFVHSGLGILSFITSLASWFLELVAIVIFVALDFISDEGSENLVSICSVVGGISLIIGQIGYLFGLVFGIVSIFERRRKKFYSIIGIILCVLGLALIILFMFFVVGKKTV